MSKPPAPVKFCHDCAEAIAKLLDSPRHRDHCPIDCICLELMKESHIATALEEISRRKVRAK